MPILDIEKYILDAVEQGEKDGNVFYNEDGEIVLDVDSSSFDEFGLCKYKTMLTMLYPKNQQIINNHLVAFSKKIHLACEDAVPSLSDKYLRKCKKMLKGLSEKAFEKLAKKTAKEVLKPLDIEYKNSGGMKSLLAATESGLNEHDWERLATRGCVAGDILTLILMIGNNGSGGSVNKAVHILELQGKLLRGRKAILESWTGFKNVSHFWAALEIIPENTSILDLNLYDFWEFLSLSEYLRMLGESHFPRAQKVPTLTPSDTWKISVNFPLIDFSKDTVIAPLNGKCLEALESYKA